MVKSKKWIISKAVIGEPTLDNFSIVEEEFPPCEDGGIIIEAEYLTVDPYMRYRIRATAVGQGIVGFAVAKIIESKNPKYPVGAYVTGNTGWRTRTYVSAKEIGTPMGYTLIVDTGDHPKSTALGILGMPGNTAYFGFLELCKPQAGETVLVNGAAGAVGSAVCQIAKIKGCKVIAFAGSDAKVAWLRELGVDHVFNYKTKDVSEALTEAAPEGINCYFDNVGGKFTCDALPHMADFARISVCGAISTYNDENKAVNARTMNSPFNEGMMIFKQLKVEGFLVPRWLGRWTEGITQMKQWADEGKIKYKETITNGFENMPSAFIGLFHGDNIGKAIVKV